MGLDDVFRDPPVWDTDSEGSDLSEYPTKRVRDWGDKKSTRSIDEEHDGTTPPARRALSPTTSRAPSSRLSSISEHGPVFVRPSLIRNVLGSSFVNGNNMISLSVLSVSGSDRESKMLRASAQVGSTISLEDSSRTLSLAPRRLLDVENGKSVILTRDNFIADVDGDNEAVVVAAKSLPLMSEADSLFFKACGQSLQDKISTGSVVDFRANDEIGKLSIGGAWRGILKRFILKSYDTVNALLLTRQLQLFMPFHTGYEAYVLGQLIEALDGGRVKDIEYTLNVAFQNRNTSRVLVQLVVSRYDFLWHWGTMITWNRPFDAYGQLPIVSFTAFPPTENFINTRNHALTSMLRIILGKGKWLTRVITGREGLITDDPNAVAQNLAAESNGFELANRNQYGTYIGRRKTNEFRLLHRLPTDESIVRTFVSQPMSTLQNNGVVHVLRQLAKHWHNTLSQQNFAHQRMEQLNPFETLRFHMPVVLLTLSSLGGRNKWDSEVLGPFVKRLQTLKPSFSAKSARYLVHELKESIVVKVCGGAALMIDPFRSWLDSIHTALDSCEEEAKAVYNVVSSVEIGIRLGHGLITSVVWKVPSDAKLKSAILNHICGLDTGNVSERSVMSALTLITPRDKRTLIELVKNGLVSCRPAQLLLSRAKTLLQRELRREVLNKAVRELSKGSLCKEPDDAESWYWLEFGNDGPSGVYMFDEKVTGSKSHRFIHVDTRNEILVDLSDASVTCREYVPIAEAISRAQRAFMNIELDHGTTFSYDAFMEFSFLRQKLRQLIAISQVTCEEIDNARLNLLVEVQRSSQARVSIQDLEIGKTYYLYEPMQKEYVPFTCEKEYGPSDGEWSRLSRQTIFIVPPQSTTVVGCGPTGMITAIHCTEAVLASGGDMKLYEARDSFVKGSAAFERAQVVRLDARWIAMLRYHLGTGFEDVFIPASGETDSQLGNTLPSQGFVEITIKDLEQMLHLEVSKMWSKGLLSVYTDSKAIYNHESNTLTKKGQYLKPGDNIHRNLDEEGRLVPTSQRWTVVELVEVQPLLAKDLLIGEQYGVYLKNRVVSHMLVSIDLRTSTYAFALSDDPKSELLATVDCWPTIYPSGVTSHGEVHSVIVECKMRSRDGGHVRESLPVDRIRNKKFTIDVGQTHVIEAIGKPHGSKVHFQVTTSEPYGVLCAQGLKVSLGMHNFGEKRWRSGIIDDVRSIADQNTRIIGDFTKMVRLAPVTEKMLEYMTDEKDKNWQTHFHMLVEDSDFPELNEIDPVVPKIQLACAEFANAAKGFKRNTLQTRFFETGDNYYLGMEFTREYDRWKNQLGSELVAPIARNEYDADTKAGLEQLKGRLMHHIDRLWYDGVLEVIRTGDVYNPGARHRVPRLYLINSYTDMKVGSFPVGESFRLSEDSSEMYEIMVKGPVNVVVRNVEGYISKMPRSTLVRREGNLTRSPDGNNESRVALATFPVAHFVNHRSLRLNNVEKGYVFAFVGDEQATPHFMRYSGLTGACINAMLLNNFIKQANDGTPFVDRYQEYSVETNWSNGEVVQRGTGNNYGEDGFLRPGFSYECVLNYLHSKVTECQESGQDLDHILSRDWKTKLAASLVPRGMELDEDYTQSLLEQLGTYVVDKFEKEAMADKRIVYGGALEKTLKAQGANMARHRNVMDGESFWDEYLSSLDVSEKIRVVLRDQHIVVAKCLDQTCKQVVDHAKEAYLYNTRISSELFNQPKPVDSIIDDFAVEAQNFANSLTQSAAFASGALALKSVGSFLAVLNLGISFGTMTNAARYKIRNEEARVIFAEEKLLGLMKAVFALMDRNEQDAVPVEDNPFVICLEQQVAVFLETLAYYDFGEPKSFLSAFNGLKNNINDPAEIHYFMKLLTTKFIVETYHVNSYVQESLVNIYTSLDEMLRLLTAHVPNGRGGNAEAWTLFLRLVEFQKELESTLQRGATRWGFVKRRRLLQWDCVAMFKYLYSLLCCSSRLCIPLTAPISTKTLSIVKHAKYLSKMHGSQILLREIRDLESLHWATRESEIASLVFMNGLAVFVASIFITVAFISQSAVLTKVSFWLTLTSAFGAILGSFYLWRKFLILVKLIFALTSKVGSASSDERFNIGKVRQVTFAQIILTLTRLLTAGAAAVAISWSVANKAFSQYVLVNDRVPFWLAVGSVCAAVFAVIFFFMVEFVVRYNLPPNLGEFVCESFRGEIEEMYKLLSVPTNNIDTKQVQERETWEYVAREFLHRYRFDAIFAADRFGSLLLYLQGGMEHRQ